MSKEKITEYRKGMEQLFTEWKSVERTEVKGKKPKQVTVIDHKKNVFIKDGVVSPETWFTQDIRPLFLLKEAYGGDKDWDMIDYLHSDIRISKMWNRIAHWTYGLMKTNANHIEPYFDYSGTTFSENNDLLQIAAINVKKSAGKNSSDWDEINAYADIDHERLMKQIELCDPTIIVCGYTATPLEIISKDTHVNFREKRNDNLYYHIEINGHDVIVLDYWHPANHYPDILNYYTLMGIYQQSLLNRGEM